MEVQTGELAVVFIPFLSLIGLSIYASLTALFLAYPFNFDRLLKRNAIRVLLFVNLAAAGIPLAALSIYLVWGPPGYHPSTDPTQYLWMLLAVIGGHTLFVQAPGAVVSNLSDRDTATRLSAVADALGDILYGPDRDRALQALRRVITDNEDLLRDYGLIEIARHFSDASIDYPLTEVAGYLLRRIEARRSRLAALQSPFRELNFIFSVTGASALAGIALAIAKG